MSLWFVRLARAGAVLALVVVMLGAWVRLTDAGLGCPDWPGCYGRLVVPDAATAPAELGSEYTRPLEAGKAWREMIHRYLASTLGLVCVALAVIAWRNRRDPAQPRRAPLALVALVVFQGLLGMWTVTLLLKPIVVVAHLLGGFATLALLVSLGRWRSTRIPAPARGAARARRRRGRGARAADLARRLDERELCRARVPGFSDVPDAVVARDRRFRGRFRAVARARRRLRRRRARPSRARGRALHAPLRRDPRRGADRAARLCASRASPRRGPTAAPSWPCCSCSSASVLVSSGSACRLAVAVAAQRRRRVAAIGRDQC